MKLLLSSGLGYPNNRENFGKEQGRLHPIGGKKMMKFENLKNEILESLASYPGLSGIILDVFGAQLRKIMTRRALLL